MATVMFLVLALACALVLCFDPARLGERHGWRLALVLLACVVWLTTLGLLSQH